MKSALIAIEPVALKGKSFEHFCEMIRKFQKIGLFSETSIVAVIHPAQFAMPYSVYREYEDELAQEVRRNIVATCAEKFEFARVRVLRSNSHLSEAIVDRLSKYGRRLPADLLVVGSNDRRGLPYWFLGSLSETASLTAKLPVLVLKNSTLKCSFSRRPNFVVGVDVAAPPSAADTNWLVALAKAVRGEIHLIYAEPQKRLFIDRLQERKAREEAIQILGQIKTTFEKKGISASACLRPEDRSVAHTVVDYATTKGALLTVSTTAKRSKVRRLVLGSTARQILALTKRPFLSLRLN